MQYWLVKSEPETFGWGDLVKDGKTTWDGVRNYAARNFLGQMKRGDLVLFYHSVSEKAVVDAVQLSDEKYCSVAATVRPTAEITTSFEIVEVE